MAKDRILVVIDLNDADRARFTAAAPGAELFFSNASDVTRSDVMSVDAIIGNVDAALIRGSERLRWMQLQNAGTEGFCTKGVLPEGCTLTNATGAYGMAISEHMVAMLFALQKRLDSYIDQQKEHIWKRREHMFLTEGATALILGMGDIGTSFAKKLKAFGVHTVGVRRTAQQKPDCFDEQYTAAALPSLLPRADIVALCLPGYSGTRHMIGTAELSLMKETAIILNVGRGTAIDTEALADALEQRRIYGAGLDVTDPEPLPAQHRLWDMPHTLITPHVSGLYALPASLEKIKAICLDNLSRFARGKALNNVIDPETGYVAR